MVLETDLATDTENAIGAGEGVAYTSCRIVGTVVIVVVGLKICGFQGNLLVGLIVEAKADAA